jgi:16S rRNA processing protein RimM
MVEEASLTIGKVVGLHGIKGLVKVRSDADSVAFFPIGEELCLKKRDGACQRFRISSCSRHKQVFLLGLEGIESIEAAQPWAESHVCIDESLLPPVEAGTYYFYQIIGLSVFTVNKRYIGRVEEIFPTGSNDVYVVKQGDKETLIPAIDSVVIRVDLDDSRIWVDLPEGLED